MDVFEDPPALASKVEYERKGWRRTSARVSHLISCSLTKSNEEAPDEAVVDATSPEHTPWTKRTPEYGSSEEGIL
jgi:hypothetical protein